MGLRSQEEVNIFLSPHQTGKLQDMTRFACLMITVRPNVTVSTNSRPFSNLDDWQHESLSCIGDIHIYNTSKYTHHNSNGETQKKTVIAVLLITTVLMITKKYFVGFRQLILSLFIYSGYGSGVWIGTEAVMRRVWTGVWIEWSTRA